MNTTTKVRPAYDHELDNVERGEVIAAALRIGRFHEDYAFARYALYRRRGLCKSVAFRCTLAWCRNMASQREGRLAHQTGAVGWT